MKKFWEHKSAKYPRPFDTGVIEETLKVIEIIKNYGVDFKNKKIIDIGSGTGIYGLVMAEYAQSVLCLDFSQNMIDILKQEANRKNISNIDCIVSDFKNFNDRRYKKYFDISFASMTPAVKTEEDIEKMENLSKKWCVYIGWAGKRENKLLDMVYSLFNLKPYIPQGFNEVKKILEKKKRNIKTHIIETSWKWSGTVDEATDEFALRIELDLRNVDRDKIRNFLKSKFPSGNVETETHATEGVIIWEV